MKKNIITIMMAFAALFMTQCKKQAEHQNAEPAGATMEVTLRVENSTDKTEITPTGIVKWEQGDRLYIVGSEQGLLGIVSAVAGGNATADFQGRITPLTSSQMLRFYYVGDKTFTLDAEGNFTFDISQQNGTLDGIAEHNQLMFGQSAAPVAVGTTDLGTINMTSLMAIAHMNISYRNEGLYEFTVTGLATSTFNAKSFDGTSAIPGTTGTINMNGHVSTDCYIALLPGVQTLQLSGRLHNKDCRATLIEKNVMANKFYGSGDPAQVRMESVEHDYVDLGLPSKLFWATSNLGAEYPDEYGVYYAWGETAGYGESMVGEGANPGPYYIPGVVKNYFDFDYYKLGNNQDGMGKYCENDGKTILDYEDDAARARWGVDWRIPTKSEYNELKEHTTQIWRNANESATINGVEVTMTVPGCYFVGSNDSYIFLPAGGYRIEDYIQGFEQGCCYWSSDLCDLDDPDYAWLMIFANDGEEDDFNIGECSRDCGTPIRPVCVDPNLSGGGIAGDLEPQNW